MPAASSRGGFSLVEVVVALAVIATALLVVLGLLGVGMSAFRQSKATSISAQIAQQIFSQIQVTPFAATPLYPTASVTNHLVSQAPATGYYQLPNPNAAVGGNIRYFDDQGDELTGTTGTVDGVTVPAVYWVNVRVIKEAAYMTTALSGAAACNGSLAEITIQVAYNPAGVTPNLDSTNKWDGTSSLATPLQIYTYNSFLAQGS